jgi:hypothetical protein
MKSTTWLLLATFLGTTDANYDYRYWTLQGDLKQSVNVYSRSPFAIYGRGYQLILSGYHRDDPVEIYIDYRYEYDGVQQAWSVHATMHPPDALPAVLTNSPTNPEVIYEGSKYGQWIATGGTFETKTFFAVSASYDPWIIPNTLRLNDTGSVYLYHGEYSHWTNTQKLRAEPVAAGAYFGTCVSICPKNPHMMVIGAEGEQSGSGLFKAGAAYIYRSSDTKTWSVTQKLTAEKLGFEDRFGFITKMYDDFLLVSSQGDDDNGVNSGSVYIFREERALGLNLWSQQQKLYSHVKSQEYGEFSEMYGHTLVVGSNQEDDYGGRTNTGAVYVYKTFPTLEPPYVPPPPKHHRALGEDNDDVPDAKPKPPPPRVMFKWWSFQQRLTPRDWHTYRYFGTYTALGGDGRLIATGAYGEAKDDIDWALDTSPHYRTGSAYIFVKHQTEHKWTQQQKFLGPSFPDPLQYYSDPYLHGSDLIIRDTSVGYVYTDKLSWGCLQIAISDHYGDGWDRAYLMAYAPGSFTKVSDHYTPYCSSPNPLKFRYCPLLDEDIGEYVFKLSDDVFKRKFWPEIRWSIKNEKDNQWYYGDAHTSIKFMWIQDRRQFDHVLDPADKLVDNKECVACSVDLRPKPKPKERALKGNDDPSSSKTRAPTYSPAPTITYSVTAGDWALMKMKKTPGSSGWWGDYNLKNGTGASYYIYDSTGTIPIYTGTICGSTLDSYNCRIELADGDYILRVGGALDKDAAGHSWEFCHLSGLKQEMVTFTVKEGKCTPYTHVTAADYCLTNYDLTIVAAGTIRLDGVLGSSLTESDLEVIGEALKTMTSVHVVKATVTLLESQGSSIIKFLAYINPSTNGYSALDTVDTITVFDLFDAEIESMSASGKLTSSIVVLSQMTRSESTTLLHLQNAQLLSVMNGGPSFSDLVSTVYEPINFVHQETQEPSPANEPKPSHWDSFLEGLLSVDSELGFVALAVVGFIVLGVAWRLSVRQSLRRRAAYSPLIASVDEVTEPLMKESTLAVESPTPSMGAGDAARSKEVMSSLLLMKDDIKKLVEIEDASLPHQVDDTFTRRSNNK